MQCKHKALCKLQDTDNLSARMAQTSLQFKKQERAHSVVSLSAWPMFSLPLLTEELIEREAP